jgi:glycosyl transferase family 25
MPVFGTQGYLLTRAGAERLLKTIHSVVRPIDDELDRFWSHGVPIISVYPFPLIETNFGSTIENTRRGYMTLGRLDAVRRLAFRASEKSRRGAYNLMSDLARPWRR